MSATDTDMNHLKKRLRTDQGDVSGEKIAQGAEGAVYRISFLGRSAIRKVRFPKLYRHPDLDRRLTTRRLAQEARTMLRLRKEGLNVPSVYYVDCKKHAIVMEDIGGITLREFLRSQQGSSMGAQVMAKAGVAVAKMHLADLVHGDLTTSNIIVWDKAGSHDSAPGAQIYLIDFGLSSSNGTDEDIAVDLYVLERAIISAHSATAPALNQSFLEAYGDVMARPSVLSRLEEVRARGRKRDMSG